MRSVSSRVWATVLIGLAALSLVLLAAGLPSLRFLPAEPFSLGSPGSPAPELDSTPNELGPPDIVTRLAVGAVSLTYLLMIVVLPAALVYLAVSPQARRETLKRLVPVLLLAAVILLIRRQPELLQGLSSLLPADWAPAQPTGAAASFDPSPPPWLIWVVSVGLGLLLLAGVAWLVRPRPERRKSQLDELATEAQSALEALRAGAGLRDTILRCYFEMSRVLQEERGLSREPSMTPREFEWRLAAAGVPQTPVQELTRLFEQVRYGAKALGEEEQSLAVSCLEAVVLAAQEQNGQGDPHG